MNRLAGAFIIVALVAGLLVLLWFVDQVLAPQSQSWKPSPELYQGKITIGAAIWPGYAALYVAEAKGYFQDERLDVEIKHYKGTTEISKDYLAGKLQGRANLTLEAVGEHLDGMDHKVVLAIDSSNGADAIVARKEIQTVRDFKGKRIAFEEHGLEEFFISYVLAEEGLSLDDVTPVLADPQGSAELLLQGAADVAVTYEPSVSRVTASGDYHVVYSSADAPGLITDILTFRAEFVERYPETVSAILRAYFRGYHFWKDHPDEANVIVGQILKASPESVARQHGGVHIWDERDNRTAFSFSSGLESLYGNMRRAQEFVQAHRGGRGPLELVGTDELIEPRFVREVSRRSVEARQSLSR